MNGSTKRLGKKSKTFWKQMKTNTQQPKLMGHSKDSPEREVHSNTGLPKSDRHISNKQPNHTPIRTQGSTTKTAQKKQKEEITQIRGELNDTETKAQSQGLRNLGAGSLKR